MMQLTELNPRYSDRDEGMYEIIWEGFQEVEQLL